MVYLQNYEYTFIFTSFLVGNVVLFGSIFCVLNIFNGYGWRRIIG